MKDCKGGPRNLRFIGLLNTISGFLEETPVLCVWELLMHVIKQLLAVGKLSPKSGYWPCSQSE